MKIENAKVLNYQLHRHYSSGRWNMGKDSKNGSFYKHVITTLDGNKYSFIAQGHRQYVYKEDTFSFEYEENGFYNNIDRESIVVHDKDGIRVWRGYAPENLPKVTKEKTKYTSSHYYEVPQYATA